MKTYADYHIHSVYSRNRHGKGTIEDIAKQAIKIGLKEIAICDHGYKHLFYGLKRKNIRKVREEIDELNNKFPEINILFGIEANILSIDGESEIDKEIIENCDIILLGFHYGASYKTLKDWFLLFKCNFLSKLSKKIEKKMIEINTKAIENALHKYKVNILTHPGDKMPVDIERIAKAAEETNTILEINNSHSHLSIEEIKKTMKYKIMYAVNSDAHSIENVGACLNGIERAKKAGLDFSRIVNIKE